MKRILWHGLAFCLIMLVFISPIHSFTEEIKETIVKLSDQIYRVTLAFGLKPNIGVSFGHDGLLLVDTGHRTTGTRLLEVLDKMDGKIMYIINTHSHGDHAGGNEICGKNAVLIHHTDLKKLKEAGIITKREERISGGNGLGFQSYYSLIFNDEEIRIIPSPGIHSDSDLIIHFTDSGVVHMGDLLLTESFPAVGNKVKEYLGFLDTMLDVFPEGITFIGGHGRDYSCQDLKDYRKMLYKTIDIVREGMKSGKNIEILRSENVLKNYENWGVFLDFLNTDKWIEFVYNSFR